ncbi:MAG: metal ABC transporter permease [Chloroflexi bacterium]|nr:metal ABC transporter permease [Chloroflexota bacterium]
MSDNLLVDLVQQSYFQRAIVAAVLVGLVCPVLGLHLVLRRLSLIGDGLGHLSFAGVSLGWLLGVYPLFSAAALALVGALGLEWLRTRQRDSGDLALALVFYSGIALGIVVTSLARASNANLVSYLFGSVLTVTPQDLATMGALAVTVLATVYALQKELFALTYDEDLARVAGLPVDRLNSVLAALTALTIVASLRIVGILLVAALLVVPVAASLLIARSFRSAIWLSAAFGVGSALAGLIAAALLDVAPGGSIVLIAVLGYLCALGYRSLSGRFSWR